ncbi:MobP3 family relaxase, partial [Faecalispora jeddahensis]
MPGARLILNSRYFHIAHAGEQADGKHVMTKDAAMGLVNYVGTRESVQLNIPNQLALPGADSPPLNLDPLHLKPGVAEKPVTKKQIDTITDLLREIPEAKNTLEYQDYRENKTIGNATELISRAAEIGLGYAVGVGEATNLVEYVGKRPGVDRVGEHGLFSSLPQVDMKQAQEDIGSCKGNIWTHVISLRREDADRLGYDQQKPWRDLIMSQVDTIAKASNIPVSDLKWYAGMHNTTHHPHIHLFVFSDNPKAGHLTKQGINEMKEAFSKVIFADERQQLYVHKTEMRDEIKQKADTILFEIQNHATAQFNEQEMRQLCEKMVQLASDLKGRTGKLQYGWIKDLNIREQVNAIMADLAKAPDIQKLYQLYCEDHEELQRMYRNDPADTTPLVKNKEFASIKNKIIREAAKLNSLSPSLKLEERQDKPEIITESEFTEQQFGSKLPDMDFEPDFPLLSEEESLYSSVPEERPENSPPDDLPMDWLIDSIEPEVLPKIQKENSTWFDVCMKKALAGDSKAKYQLGSLYYSGKSIPRDYEKAAEWFTRASMDEIPEAQYRLAQMYQFGRGVEKDEELGGALYRKAQINFLWQSGHKPDAPAELKMAKMFFYGQGCEQDYAQAAMWYGLAAAHGDSMAKYELGKMYLYGIGIETNEELGKEYLCDAYWSFRSFINEAIGFDIGSYVDNGTADTSIVSDKNTAYLMYLVGRMEYAGEGIERNYKKALQWYKLAASGGHIHSNYCVAKMYYAGESVLQDYDQAKKWYATAAEGKDKYAYYALGKMYDTGTGVEQNDQIAAAYFAQASEEDVPYAHYRLAQFCETGRGMEQDVEVAQILYAKALKAFQEQELRQPDASTELKIAQMYLYGKGSELNIEEAVKWFQQSSEKNEPRAMYQMALLYRDGIGIEANEIYAEDLFCKALAGFLQLEEETPSAQIEYKIAGMYARGDGTVQDSEQAFQWYLTAAENGHSHGVYCVAKAYEAGNGTEQNMDSAIGWYKKAADSNDTYAMYALGKLYRDGAGVEMNPVTSFRYFAAAAQLGNGHAQYACASALLHGIGVQKDTGRAIQLYTDASMKGNYYADYQLGELYSAGVEVSKDEQLAEQHYAAALNGFLRQEENEPDAQLEYRIA